MVNYADYTAPTGQHELDHADQEYTWKYLPGILDHAVGISNLFDV